MLLKIQLLTSPNFRQYHFLYPKVVVLATAINLHTPKLGQFDPEGISHIITQKLAWIENNPYMNLSEILSGTFSRREKIISNNGFYVKIKKLSGQFDPKNINWQKRWHLLRYPWFVKKLKLVQRNPLVELWTIMFGDHKWRKKWNSLIFDWIRAINVIEKTSRKTSNYRIFIFFFTKCIWKMTLEIF